jgi:hypothetical protein
MEPSAQLVLIVVFDGLRPDFVRPDWTPHLWGVRRRGVWFERSHCAFPAVTRVNAAALVTGSFAGGHGIASNTIWRPAVDPTRPLRTGERADLLRLEAVNGRLLAPPTLGEVLADHGLGMAVVGTGSSGATTLLHPQAAATAGRVLHYSFCSPHSLSDQIAAVLGPWPQPATAPEHTAAARVGYGIEALAGALLPETRPASAIFWSTVPDGLHHRYGLGHPPALAGLKEADAAFGRLLDACHTLYEAVNVIITADHGYLSVSGHVDLAGELVDAGLKSSRDSTDIVICVDGGAASIYTDAGVDQHRLARWLLARPWASVLFSPGGRIAGTLPLEAAGGGGPDAPDLMLCLGWNDDENEFGVRGAGWGGGAIAVGAGDHGGLSSWEMRNTLIAAGPAFREGIRSDLPCGIVDIAPTTLACLGVSVPAVWHGRILSEALRDGVAPVPEPAIEYAALCATDGGPVRQTLRVETAGGVRYPASAWPSGPV